MSRKKVCTCLSQIQFFKDSFQFVIGGSMGVEPMDRLYMERCVFKDLVRESHCLPHSTVKAASLQPYGLWGPAASSPTFPPQGLLVSGFGSSPWLSKHCALFRATHFFLLSPILSSHNHSFIHSLRFTEQL
jgi:hypothetical protein